MAFNWRRYRRKRQTFFAQIRKRVKKKIQSDPLILNVIPSGAYCYRYLEAPAIKSDWTNSVRGFATYTCPFWSWRANMPEQEQGYCSLMEVGDDQLGFGLLWDQVKECGLKRECVAEEEEFAGKAPPAPSPKRDVFFARDAEMYEPGVTDDAV